MTQKEISKNWLKKQNKQKPTWNEEDENKAMWLVRLISTAGFRELDNDKMPCSRSELLNWLKSLKDKAQPQPQQDWNQEDERKLELLKALIEDAKRNSASYSTMFREMEELNNWLR